MRIRTAAVGALCVAAALLTACSTAAEPEPRSAPKNGDAAPLTGRAGAAGKQSMPVPHGKGSRLPFDFNGDGNRDLVLNDLVKAPGDSLGDDAGIGIVYGTAGPRTLDPAVRQLLTPVRTPPRSRASCPPRSTPRPPATSTRTVSPTSS